MDIIVSKVNESFVEVNADESVLHDLYSRYSEYVAGFQFNPRYKSRIWDGKIHLFNIRAGLLPFGFVRDLYTYAKNSNQTIDFRGISQTDFKEELDEEWYKNVIEDNMKNNKLEVRDYQDEAIRAALTNHRGILLSCTSSGKSLIIYNLIRTLRKKGLKKILLIVPNIMLVEQMYKDFKEYGYENLENEVEQLGGGNKATFDTPILISTWQSLQNEEPDFFEVYDGIICDECHGSKAKAMVKILNSCKNAKFRIGTTGTLPTDKAEALQIKAVLGEVIFELRSKELIDRGMLTKLQIANILLKYPEEFVMRNRERSYPEEVKMIEEYPDRNKVLRFIIDHTDNKHNVLILVNHVKHLKDVQTWLNEQYPDRKVSIIAGDVKAKDREDIRIGIENEDGTLLLATYGTMSTGVNMPKLHDIVLYANSKSKIKVLQSIGRGLRKHSSKNKIILFDVVDDLSYKTKYGRIIKNYLMKHWDERLKYYTEQEFPSVTTKINI